MFGDDGLRIFVDRDAAVRRDLDADGFKPEPFTFGWRPVANITWSATIVLAVGQLDAKPVIHLLDRGDRLPGDDLDAAPLHFVAQMRAHVVVEAAQNIIAAIDQRHIAAEAGKDSGKLHRDIAAALDENALRKLLEMERLVRGNHVLEPGDLGARGTARRRSRSGSCRRAHAPPVASRTVCGVFEHGAALDEVDLVALERRRIGGLEARDLAILVGDQVGQSNDGFGTVQPKPAASSNRRQSARHRPEASSARSRE